MPDCPFEINGLCRASAPQNCSRKCEAKNEDGKIRYGEPMKADGDLKEKKDAT